MAKSSKQNNISFLKMDKLAASCSIDNKEVELSIDDETVILEVKPLISALEMAEFISGIVNTAITEDEERHINYTPLLAELLFQAQILNYYTNIKTNTNLERIYGWITTTNIYETVLDIIDNGQVETLKKSLSAEIDFQLKYGKYSLNGKIGSLVDAVNDYISTQSSSLKDINVSTLEEFMKNYNPDDVAERLVKNEVNKIRNTPDDVETSTQGLK